MIEIKPGGASLEGCRPEILIALIDIDPIFNGYGVNTVVTSGAEDYKHTALRSKHYCGDAVDTRIKHIASDAREAVVNKIRNKLGKNFVVIHEGLGHPWEHIHIHYAPTFG